jgi:hypothetical protein
MTFSSSVVNTFHDDSVILVFLMACAERMKLHLGLRGEMTVIVFGATLALVSLFAYLGTAALDENIRRTLQERVVLAQATARHLDYMLANVENFLRQATTQGDRAGARIDARDAPNHARRSRFADHRARQ